MQKIGDVKIIIELSVSVVTAAFKLLTLPPSNLFIPPFLETIPLWKSVWILDARPAAAVNITSTGSWWAGLHKLMNKDECSQLVSHRWINRYLPSNSFLSLYLVILFFLSGFFFYILNICRLFQSLPFISFFLSFRFSFSFMFFSLSFLPFLLLPAFFSPLSRLVLLTLSLIILLTLSLILLFYLSLYYSYGNISFSLSQTYFISLY